MNWTLELVILPVSDVDRAKDFYSKIGFNVDHDHVVSDEIRSSRSPRPARPVRSRSARDSPTPSPGR